MENDKLVLVHTFTTRAEAEMGKSALGSAGIECVIQADSAGGMEPQLAWTSGGFRVLVYEDDVAAANAVFAPID